MRFVYRKDRLPGIAVLALLSGSFLLLIAMTSKPAHAGNPAISNTAGCNLSAGSCSWTLTVGATGDAIAIAASFVDSLTNAPTVGTILTITDTASDIYSQQGVSRTTVGANCKVGFCLGNEVWSASALASGSDTITVTTTGPNANLTGIFTAFDMANVSPGILFRDTGACNASGACLSGTTIQTGTGNTFGAATIEIAATAMPAGGNPPTAGSGYTVTSSAIAIGAIEDSLTVASPTQYPFVKNSGGGQTYWTDLGVVFGVAGVTTTTSTTTINTGCLGACSGGNNGTKTYFSVGMPQLFVYDQSQNTANAAQIDNVTLKVASVKTTVLQPTCDVLVYVPATATSPPSANNLWTLVPGTGTTVVTLQNGSVSNNIFIHVNPQASIAAFSYYAVGIFCTSTHSRGGGSVGSGVAFYDTSQVGIPQYSYDMGGSTPANTFYANTLKSPYVFMYVHTTFPTTLLTTTTTSTLTGTFTSTVTTTSTSTATTIDSTFFLQNANYPLIMLVLFLPTALFLGVTKSIDGAFVGLLIGSVILIVLIPSLSFLFTGLIIVTVTLAIIAHRGR